MAGSGKMTGTTGAARKRKTAQVLPLTRRERVESKESAILDVAYRMFVSRGFAKTTIAEIASQAGVAEGTLYLYFNNKEALARGALAAFYRTLTDGAQKGIEKLATTRERLEFLAHHHLKNIIKEHRLLELLSILDRDVETYEGSEIYKMNRAYVAVFDSVVRDGMWRGDIDESVTPWVYRDIFYGGLEYAMRTMFIKSRKKSADTVVADVVRLMMNNEKETSGAGQRDDRTCTIERLEAAVRRLETMIAD